MERGALQDVASGKLVIVGLICYGVPIADSLTGGKARGDNGWACKEG